MSNVIALNARLVRQPLTQRLALHARLFAGDRRSEEDVFWLKENAEFLNILQATGLPSDALLETYESFYDQVESRLGQYPQYYRFFLSICMDLEDLGMPGHKGAALCAWVQNQGLAEAELSDLQRAEAYRLLARRNVARPEPALNQRLHRFIDRTATFSIPNKKAAYELTHILFYLSDYGRKQAPVSAKAVESLTYAGLLAYLDQNYDLLGEVCIALRYAGVKPSPIWEGAVAAALHATRPVHQSGAMGPDDYHPYLIASWLCGLAGKETFPVLLDSGCQTFDMAPPPARPLLDISRALSENRSGNWEQARARVTPRLGSEARCVLAAAEQSTDLFEDFYAGFARSCHPEYS